jgi:DNA-binding NarL/FixJ family response regulator
MLSWRRLIALSLAYSAVVADLGTSHLFLGRRVTVGCAVGMTYKEIAAEMYVTEKAVEYHLRNVYGKLGISSRRELRAQG